jgi:putative heme-binding domain-containing protein
LWALRHAKALKPSVVAAAMRDSHAGVRENALQLAVELPGAAELHQAMVSTATDPDARVRLAAALALGQQEGVDVVAALAAIARRDAGDRWVRAAVLASAGGRMADLFTAVRPNSAVEGNELSPLMEQLGRTMAVAGDVSALRVLFAEGVKGNGGIGWRIALARGVIEGSRARAEVKSAKVGPVKFLLGDDETLRVAWRSFALAAGRRAEAGAQPLSERIAALSLLGELSFEESGMILLSRLDPREPAEIQQAAVKALERVGDSRAARGMVSSERWPRYTPQLRETVVSVLVAKADAAGALLDAVEAGVVRAADLSSTRRTQLLKHADATVRVRAEALLRNLEDGDRMAVYRRLRDGLAGGGDVEAGRVVFAQVCAACHTYAGVGGRVGPDLSGVKRQPADALLLHIVVPNYEVMPAYQAVEVALAGGRVTTGWVAAETDLAVTLRTPAGNDETVLRSEISRWSTSGLSLMPDGLEQSMPGRGIYDLIAYLKGGW